MTAEQRTQLDTDLATLRTFLTPERWTWNAPARTADGEACPSDDSKAVRWCAEGAWTHLANRRRIKGDTAFDALIHERTKRYGNGGLTAVNDGYGYDAVIALLYPVTDAEAAS